MQKYIYDLRNVYKLLYLLLIFFMSEEGDVEAELEWVTTPHE